MRYIAFVGRQLFSLLFIIASANHFDPETIAAAARHGVPAAIVLVPLSGVMALMGGLSVLVGLHARVGAALLVVFLIPVTFLMHNFWSFVDPTLIDLEKAMFMKNLTMLGGALLITYFGAGPLSFDALIERHLTDRRVEINQQPLTVSTKA
jgi:putative oxidoreductase